ncbi:MAG: HEAT repeat domain-containing protein [Planctomycetes bacterium]|nr:HEAT repeat domain-containing protein [Planctomycetota bacterium]
MPRHYRRRRDATTTHRVTRFLMWLTVLCVVALFPVHWYGSKQSPKRTEVRKPPGVKVTDRTRLTEGITRVEKPKDVQLDRLLLQLQSPDAKVRYRSAVALGTIGDLKAIPALIKGLADRGKFRHDLRMHPSIRDDMVQGYVSVALAQIGQAAVEPLISALSSPDHWVRKGSLNALGRIDDERVVVPVIRSLEDQDPLVRSEAARMLGWISRRGPDSRVLDGLTRCLQDESVSVRRSAVTALGEELKMHEPLIQVLDDSDSDVRNEAIHQLGVLQSARAVPALLGLLSRTRDHATLSYIASAFERIGDPRAIEPLRQVVRDTERQIPDYRRADIKEVVNKIQQKNGMQATEKYIRGEWYVLVLTGAFAGVLIVVAYLTKRHQRTRT